MGFITWLILGALAGWIASLVMGTSSSQGMLEDILLGIVGAFVGGFLMNLFGQSGVSGLNLYSLIVAAIGAIVLIAAGRALRRGTV